MATNDFNVLTEKDGRQLAVAMMREMQTLGDDALYIGGQQDNIVMRYFDGLRQHGNDDATAGFCAVLTDAIGATLFGVTTPIEFYEKFDGETQPSIG